MLFPLPLTLSIPPTLNPDPEALLDFTCRALSQAGVQPSIVHLGTGQGDQLLPHVHPSCHRTLLGILFSILLLMYKVRTECPHSSCQGLSVCF